MPNNIYGGNWGDPGLLGAMPSGGAGNWMSAVGGLGGGGAPGFNMGSSIGGGIGGFLGNLFGDYTNPVDAANPYFQQGQGYLSQGQGYLGAIPGQLQGIFGPYMQNAQSMYGPLSQQLQALMNNPGQRLNEIGQNYSASPGYEWMKNQALQAGQHAANAGGMTGTPMNQQQQMQLATQLANQDYYNYLNQATGLYGQGLQGGQNIYGIGANAAGQYGQGLGTVAQAQAQQSQAQANLAAQQAEAAAAGAQAGNQQESSFWSGLGSLAGGALGFLL